MVEFPAGRFEKEFVHTFPLSQFRIDGFTFGHRLVRAGRVDFVRGFAVHPVVRAAESGSLRADNADMTGGK